MERWHLVESVVKELDANIESVWFIEKDDLIGLSPDGIKIDTDGKIRTAYEIKSPEIQTCIKYWLDDKIPDEYFWQVVHYFVVLDDLEEVVFIVANPDVPDERFRIRKKVITRKEMSTYISIARDDILIFRREYTEMLNKLLSL